MSMEPGKMQSKQADQAGVRLCLRLITLFILTVGRVGADDVISSATTSGPHAQM